MLFGYRVREPERYGVAEADAGRHADLDRGEAGRSEVEHRGDRPVLLRQRRGRDRRDLRPSSRGELEITDLNNVYVAAGHRPPGRPGPRHRLAGHRDARFARRGRASSSKCSNTARACGSRASRRSRCGAGFIDAEQAFKLGAALSKSGYGTYVMDVARRFDRACRVRGALSGQRRQRQNRGSDSAIFCSRAIRCVHRRVRREQVAHALTAERVRDHHVAGRDEVGRLGQRLGGDPDLELVQALSQRERVVAELGAGRVGLVLAGPADRQLDQAGRQRAQDQHQDRGRTGCCRGPSPPPKISAKFAM